MKIFAIALCLVFVTGCGLYGNYRPYNNPYDSSFFIEQQRQRTYYPQGNNYWQEKNAKEEYSQNLYPRGYHLDSGVVIPNKYRSSSGVIIPAN